MNYLNLCVGLVFCFGSFIAVGQKLPAGPQVATFYSDVDDTEQPYGLYIPKNYDAQRKYPLVVMLHGAGSNHRLSMKRVFGKSNLPGETDVEASRYFPEWKDVEYFVASPYARGTMGYQGIAEKDVMDVLTDVKKRFSIDEDRIYLTGLSMGGGGTLWIGLTRPDLWAAMAPVCPAPPPGTDDLAVNGLNIPFHFFHGDQDQAVPVTVSRNWTKKLKELGAQIEYIEYPGVNHNSWENAYKDGFIFEWFSKFKRNAFPNEVRFNSRNYKYTKAYWVHIDQLTPGSLATITAKFVGINQLEVATSSLGAFTLTLARHPQYKAGTPIQVTVDGKKLNVATADALSFKKEGGQWAAGIYVAGAQDKKQGAEGPLFDVFSSRHVYVYGTSGNPNEDELKKRKEVAEQAANWSVYRSAFLGRILFFPRVAADKDIRASDYESANLILFGTKETNTIINNYSSQLPLELAKSAAGVGLFYVYPVNGHYIAVCSGIPWWVGAKAPGYSVPPPMIGVNGFKDFILFKGNADNKVADGFFDEHWNTSEADKKVLNGTGLVTVRH
jgi:predicted esterase